MNQLHQELSNNLTWYRRWHERPRHSIVHYGLFLGVLVLFSAMLVSTPSTTKAVGNTYYIAPTGSNGAAGTLAAPWGLTKLESITLSPGDTVYLRGGIYTSTKGANAGVHLNIHDLHGAAGTGNMITIANYPGETPIFDLYNVGFPTNANPWGVILESSTYVNLKGLVIRNLRQAHSGTTGLGISRGFLISNSDNNTVEQLNVYNIAGTGFSVEHSNNNLILNNDSHHNGEGYDTGYGAWNTGDGFSIGTGGDTSSNNVFQGNRMYLNSDDGIDGFDWAGTKIAYIGNWSFWNGVKPWKNAVDVPADAANVTSTTPTASMTPGGWSNVVSYVYAEPLWAGEGFKLGGHNTSLPSNGDPNSLRKFLYNNVAFENSGGGFQQNMDAPYAHKMQLVNNIAWGNGNDGFGFGAGRSSNPTIQHIFMNNIAWNNNRGYTEQGDPSASGGDFVFDGTNGTSTTNGTSVPSISTNYWQTVYGNNFGNLKSGTVTIAASDFQSLVSTGVDGPRQADGSLPNLPFLKLSTTSKFIDKGTIISNLNGVTIAYNSTKPDLGAYESGTTTSGDTTPPTITITNPPAGAVISGSYNVTATATDTQSAISKVDFYRDGTTLIGSKAIAPYTISWDSTTAGSNGAHMLSAKATDTATNVGTSPTVNVTVSGVVLTPDVTLGAAPTTLSLPTNGGTADLALSVKEVGGGATTAPITVRFTKTTGYSATLLSTANWTIDNTNPNWYILTSKTGVTIPANGSSTISIRFTRSSPNQSVYPITFRIRTPSAGETNTANNVMSVTVNTTTTGAFPNDTPIADAGANQTISGTTATLTGIGYDLDGTITSYAWTKVSGSGTITTTNAATTGVTGLTIGTSVFKLTVTDNQGGTGSATTTLTVSATTNPIVLGTLTVNGSTNPGTISGSNSVQITATSTTTTITKVEFYRGTTLIGTDTTSSPFDIAGGWNTTTVANGTYVLTAKAYDSAGNTKTSTGVTVTIAN